MNRPNEIKSMSKKTKTQSEWFFDSTFGQISKKGLCVGKASGTCGDFIRLVNQANSAPALFMALRNIVEMHDLIGFDAPPPFGKKVERTLAKARAAIADAEGGL